MTAPTPPACPLSEERVRELAITAEHRWCNGDALLRELIQESIRLAAAEAAQLATERAANLGQSLAVSDETPQRKSWNAALAAYRNAIREQTHG